MDSEPVISLLLTALVMGAAGLVQGATGFGFAIVAMALLPLPFVLRDFEVAFPLVALNGLVIPVLIMGRHRKSFDWHKAAPLVLGGVFGTVTGFCLMHGLSGRLIFLRIFGATLLVTALFDIWLARVVRTRLPTWMAVPCGFVGGFFGGAFNIGGPPFVVYAYSQPWTKSEIVSTLQVSFLCSTGLRLLLMGKGGYFDQRVVLLTLFAVIPTAIGITIGTHLLHRANLNRLKTFVFALVALLGFKYLLFPG